MQETTVVFFSHRFEILIEKFIQNFYCKKEPFGKNLIIVPHLSMKSYLMQSLSQRLGIAAGLKIVTLGEAVALLFDSKKKKFPKFLDLSLLIQHEILSLIETNSDELLSLINYVNSPARSLRIAQLSDLLSATFIDYCEYGGRFLEPWLRDNGWQQQLWKKIFSGKRDIFYTELLKEFDTDYKCHLFGFHFIPDLYLNFFKKINSKFYLFSPCQTFWADSYSEKEIVRMKTLSLENKEENQFLANWGKVGRKFFSSLLDRDFLLEEDGFEATGLSMLELLQNSLLKNNTISIELDTSIQLFSAPSKLREIEILYENLAALFEKKLIKPHEVAVYAPDINEYAPFIQSVFFNTGVSFSLFNLEKFSLSPVLQALKQLLELSNEKFSKESILKLFRMQPFRDKFHFSTDDLKLIEFWAEKSGVRWGLDSEQRLLLLSQTTLEDSDVGTWEKSMDRLLLGLASLEDGCIQLSECELFNQLLCILRSLKEELKPLFDKTQKFIPDWLDYFEKLIKNYFSGEIDEFVNELVSLRKNSAELVQHEVDYESVKRIIFSYFAAKNGTLHESHLHGIRAASIVSGGIVPSKLIYLIGMQEEAFPRKNRRKFYSAEFESKGDYRPTQTDEDRFLFLQLLMSAGNYLYLSYQRLSEEDQKLLRPCHLIEELKLTVTNGSDLPHEEKVSPPLLPELYSPMKLELEQSKDLDIDLDQISAFAKHPLRFYLREVLQLSVAAFERNEEEEEFILSNLNKKAIREKSFKEPLTHLLQESELKGLLPRGIFKQIALRTVRTEIESLESHFDLFQLSKTDITREEINLTLELKNGYTAKIKGSLEGISSQGFVFYGENELKDLVKIWPLFLISLNQFEELPPVILFSKTGEKRTFSFKDVKRSLQSYLYYYQLGQEWASPLLPQFAEMLLEGTPEGLDKKMEEVLFSSYTYQDKALQWIYDRDKMPNSSAIFQNWGDIIKEAFNGL